MKFSIIVPVYNAEDYIDTLVRSALGQTHEEFELILVDDGSKDNSYNRIKEYQKADPRIQAYTKPNTGPGMTREYGFEKATGELLFFVDSDDWITSPTVLEEINGLFEENPQIDVLFFDREDCVGDKKEIIRGFEELPEGLHGIDEINEVIRPGLGAKILRRSILTPEMFYESTVFEDLYTTYAYLEKCRTFYYCPKCFYTIYHEVNSNSLSSQETDGSFLKALEMVLHVYNRTENASLRYSIQLWMATLFAHYGKVSVTKPGKFRSGSIKQYIQQIVKILRENHVILKPKGKKKIKVLIYKVLLYLHRRG